MNLIHIVNGSNSWEFQINCVKYLICKNNNYYPIYSSIKQFVSKEKSIYRDENNLKVKLMIDDQEFNLKSNLFIEITDMYSLNDDSKLNTKSLMLKYLEIKLQQADFIDTINTIDILLHTLSDDINESSTLKVMFQSLGYKQLLKMLRPFLGNDYEKDEYDLSLTELLDFQIKLIEYIAMNNVKYDNVIVYGRLNNIDKYVVEQLNSLTNCKVIVFTNCFNEIMKLDDICLIDNNISDLANMEAFYHLFSIYSFRYYTIEEVKGMIKKYLKTKYTHRNYDIYQELEHLFK